VLVYQPWTSGIHLLPSTRSLLKAYNGLIYIDGIPEEEPTSAIVSETSVYGWKSPISLVRDNATTNYNSLTHVYGKQAGANTINRSPTTVSNDQLASALFAQQLPPLPKFSGE